MSAPAITTFDYQLNRLTFEGGGKMLFPKTARMRYGDAHRGIWIEMTRGARFVPPHLLAKIEGEGTRARVVNDPPELRRIEYKMFVTVDGVLESFGFYHVLKPGSGVVLARFDDGDLFFQNADQASMFTKDFTLRDVTGGEIDSGFKVWQFHGYRHEH